MDISSPSEHSVKGDESQLGLDLQSPLNALRFSSRRGDDPGPADTLGRVPVLWSRRTSRTRILACQTLFGTCVKSATVSDPLHKAAEVKAHCKAMRNFACSKLPSVTMLRGRGFVRHSVVERSESFKFESGAELTGERGA